VEVGHVEQFRVTVLEPLSSCDTLAFRTVSISARVVRHTLMAAIIASFDVPAESRGAVTLDRVHGAPPRGRQRPAMLITESRATEPVRQAGTRSGTVGTMTLSVSQGLTVAHTLSVAIMRYRAVVPITMTEQQLDGT
jgi:hypothetical protein